MKRKEFIFIAAALLIVFAGIITVKRLKQTEKHDASTVVAKSDSAQTFWSYYDKATQYRLQSKFDSSLVAYLEALKINPNHNDALYYVGNMYMEVGQFDEAQKPWEKLIELNPQSERAYNQLGNLFFCMSHPTFFHPKKAKTYFEQVYNLNKEALNPNFHLGEIALFQGRTNDAYIIFQKLSMMEQKNIEIGFLMGYLNWKSGNTAEALADFERALDLQTKASKEKDPSTSENQECDLFIHWINSNLTANEKHNNKAAMPRV